MSRCLFRRVLLGAACLPALAGAQSRSSQNDTLAPSASGAALRTITIDERLVTDHGFRLGDTLVVAGAPRGDGERVVVGAVVRRGSDPSEVARAEYKVRLHLGQLQRLTGNGDRVDRFAVAAVPGRTDSALAAINARAFGFRAHRSVDVASGASRTFAVVSRFNRAIGVITIVASAIFLLCIMLLKVEERRRDVAALRLLGVSRQTVTRAVVLEAACIALLGSAGGVAFGYVSEGIINSHYRGVYRTPLAFSLVTTESVVFAVTLSIVLGIGAGWLAARRLVRASPLSLFGR